MSSVWLACCSSRKASESGTKASVLVSSVRAGPSSVGLAAGTSGRFTVTGLTATVFTNWGRAGETRQTLSLRLEKVKDKVSVGTVEIKP